MHRLKIIIPLVLLALLIIGCSADLPTPTPAPEQAELPTATAETPFEAAPLATPITISSTATAIPTTSAAILPSPTPQAGFYRNNGLGFWFNYPASWNAETIGGTLPAVRLSDPDDPIQLIAGGQTLEEGITLEDFTATALRDVGVPTDYNLISESPTSLSDGTPASEITITFMSSLGQELQGNGLATVKDNRGYMILIVARADVLQAFPNTIAAINSSLHLEQPELYDISRENALILLASDPGTLDPAMSPEGAAGLVGHVFSGLVQFNSELEIVGDLAESWQVSADGLTYTFQLHEDIEYHSGDRLRADHIKRAWERALDPDLGSRTAPLHLKNIDGFQEMRDGSRASLRGVTALDDETLEVRLSQPVPYFLAKIAQPVAFVVNPANVTDGDWWLNADGNGPFAIDRYRRGQTLILERFEAYHLTPTALDNIVYLLFGEFGLSAYEAGQVDVAKISTFTLDRALDPADPLASDVQSVPLLCTQRVIFNVNKAPFDDPMVRQAFSLVINRQQLADVTQNGAALPATSVLPPAMPGYVARSAVEQFDVATAQSLLDGSSYGENLPEITFTVPGRGEPGRLIAALGDAWQSNLGLDIATRLIEPADYLDTVLNGDTQLFIYDWCADYPDPENMLDLLYHSASSVNLGGYNNPQVDSLLEQARIELDQGARISLYQEAEALILADAATIQVIHPINYILVQEYIQGFVASPIPVLWQANASIER